MGISVLNVSSIRISISMSFTVGVLFVVAVAMVTEMNAASCDPDKQTMCTMDYRPVCATFTKTFSNRCVMESQLCALAQEGFEYNARATRDRNCCDRPVPNLWRPTCGSDGVMYDNPFDLRLTACANQDYITAVDAENCQPPTEEPLVS